jgi:hypothetical protein
MWQCEGCSHRSTLRYRPRTDESENISGCPNADCAAPMPISVIVVYSVAQSQYLAAPLVGDTTVVKEDLDARAAFWTNVTARADSGLP